ncbi:MAG: hypothetical protein MUE98_03485 [Rhodobacteraceae bacterium]|nr:hypothetical protein [Paracoccaceae bacterium]
MTARADLSILPGGAGAAGLGPLRFRGLGRAGDLDLDFADPDRPRLVTAVLAACAEPACGDDPIWALTLAARIGGLLAVWSAASGDDLLELRLRCPGAGCGADLEAGLPVTALVDLAREAEAAPVLELPDGLRLRRPTGADQRLWRRTPERDPEGAILATLTLAGQLPDTREARVELAEQMAEFDPLPAFAVTIRCPDCGRESTIPADLEAECLARLARVQDRLFADVDALARRYGWTDAAILDMPARRRARYLAMAEAEGGWP